MSERTRADLKELQALPLDLKIMMSKRRIRDWVNEFGENGVYVSFSGGKDSTVLLDLVRQDYPDVEAVYVDTGLEYPEIREFVKGFENVTWLKPKKTFKQVINDYGYPLISKEVSKRVRNITTWKQKHEDLSGSYAWALFEGSKTDKEGNKSRFTMEKYRFLLDAPFPISHQCCDVMKKAPMHKYERESGKKCITGMMAEESRLRMTNWLRYGCNSFTGHTVKSNPLSFWREQDILKYIYIYNLPIASAYGDVVIDYEAEDQCSGQLSVDEIERVYKTTGCSRTGCMFCGFGCHLEKEGEGRFEKMRLSHPKQYDYIMKPKEAGGLGFKAVIDWLNENGNLNIKY